MRFLPELFIAVIATIAMGASTGSAMAYINASSMVVPESQGYGGAWPVTVTRSQFHNGTGCLTLTGGVGGGSASLVLGGQTYQYGSFAIVNQLLMATIIKPSGSQNGALTFAAPAGRGRIGRGIFEDIQGGSSFDVGALTFGTKGAC